MCCLTTGKHKSWCHKAEAGQLPLLIPRAGAEFTDADGGHFSEGLAEEQRLIAPFLFTVQYVEMKGWWKARERHENDRWCREKERGGGGEQRENVSSSQKVMKNRPLRVQRISIHYLHLQLSVMKNSYMKTDPSIAPPPPHPFPYQRKGGQRAHFLDPFGGVCCYS